MMILLVPLSPVIAMLHHPRVVQTRKKKREQKTEKRMICIVVEALKHES